MSGFAPPQLSFNYLGRFAAGGEADWSGASEGEGLAVVDAAQPLSHAIAIDALTLEARPGRELVANWTWAPSLLSEARCGSWRRAGSAALRGAGAACGAAGAGGRSPSDLALVALSQAEIERLERSYPAIEDILPLTPLQEGLLFHALYDAGRAGRLHGAARPRA